MSGQADVVRLSVNLAPTVADALRLTAAERERTVTETIRDAVRLLALVHAEQRKGHRVMVVEGRGDDATFRELVIL